VQRTGHKRRRKTPKEAHARIAVVVSQFNEDVTSRLLQGATDCLQDHGIGEKYRHVVRCPGAFEIPQAARALLARGGWDGVVCLGAVIRGETPHFDYVSTAAALGIQTTALAFGVPVGFGVLTTDTLQQALERAGGKHGNKGWEAAEAVISMIRMQRDLERAPGTRRSRRPQQ